MKPREFEYVKAHSVEHALTLLAEEDDAKVLAGGQSLIPTLNMRLSAPKRLVDINDVAEMQGIELQDGYLYVGALTRHAELQQSQLVATHVPLLATAIAHVAHAAIRNRGTIGGNLAMADPASELPACSVALNAEFTIAGISGMRTALARSYFKGLYETDLQADELLVGVRFPIAGASTVSAFREHVRRRGDFANTGLVVSAERDGADFTDIAAVFFAVADRPVMAQDAVACLLDGGMSDANIQDALKTLGGELEIIGDVYTGEAMKMHLAKHYFKEAMEEIRG